MRNITKKIYFIKVDPLIMLLEVFVFLGDFRSHAQSTLKSFIFEIEVVPFKSAHFLKKI